MPVKGLLNLSFLAASMVASATAFAQDQPRSMLGDFDLKSVILSPAPLGPPSQFEPPAIAATPETTSAAAAEPDTKPASAKPDPKPVVAKSEAAPRKVTSSKSRQKSAVAARKPKASPLDSYARDARRQTWPCNGGGICAWTTTR